jgi:hypothetical protein
MKIYKLLLLFLTSNVLLSPTSAGQWAEKCLQSMTLEEKLAQLILVGSANNVDEVKQVITKFRVGGVVNVDLPKTNVRNQLEFNKRFHEISPVPLWVMGRLSAQNQLEFLDLPFVIQQRTLKSIDSHNYPLIWDNLSEQSGLLAKQVGMNALVTSYMVSQESLTPFAYCAGLPVFCNGTLIKRSSSEFLNQVGNQSFQFIEVHSTKSKPLVEEVSAVLEELKEYYNSQKVCQVKLDQIIKQSLLLKESLLLHQHANFINNRISDVLDQISETEELVFSEAMTLAKNEKNLLPISNEQLYDAILIKIGVERVDDSKKEYISQTWRTSTFMPVYHELQQWLTEKGSLLASKRLVLINLCVAPESVTEYEKVKNIIDFCNQKKVKTIVSVFTGLDSLKYVKGATSILWCGSYHRNADPVAKRVILGEQCALGKLPIKLKQIEDLGLSKYRVVPKTVLPCQKNELHEQIEKSLSDHCFVPCRDIQSVTQDLNNEIAGHCHVENFGGFVGRINSVFQKHGLRGAKLLPPLSTRAEPVIKLDGLSCEYRSVGLAQSASQQKGYFVSRVSASLGQFIKPNDQIISVNGRDISAENDLNSALSSLKSNATKVQVVVRRLLSRNVVTVDVPLVGGPIDPLSVCKSSKSKKSVFVKVKSVEGDEQGQWLESAFNSLSQARNLCFDLREVSNLNVSNLHHLCFILNITNLGHLVNRDLWENISKISPCLEYTARLMRPNWQLSYLTKSPIDLNHRKIVVFIDQETSQLAEVFVSALKSTYPDVLVVGQKSKGLVFMTKKVPLMHGFQMHLPEKEYFSPTGQYLNGSGIEPDIQRNFGPVSDNESEALKLLEWVESLESKSF